jgi:putative oxidoreductase
MKIAYTIVRILLGALFVFSATMLLLMKLGIMSMPDMPEGPMKTFNTGIMASVYLLPLIKITEVTCALAFLTNRYVVLASVVICPITINIFLTHAFLAPDGLAVGIFVLFGNLFLAYVNREHYKALFVAKA